LVAIADTYLNFALRIENVELRDNERSDSIDHNGIAQHGEVQPSAPARAARDRSILFAAVADFARVEIGHLRGKRTAAYTSRVSLGYASDSGNTGGRNTQTCTRAAGSCIRRGHEGIGTIIDIEHGALSALKKDRAAFVERAVHKRGGVHSQRPQALGIFEILFGQTLDFERHSISRAADGVLF